MRRACLLVLAALAGCTSWIGAPAPHHGAHWEWDYPSVSDQTRLFLGLGPPTLRKKRYTHYMSAGFGGEREPSLIYGWNPELEAYVFKNGTVVPEDPERPPLVEPTSSAAYRWAFEDLDRVLEQIPRADRRAVDDRTGP